MPRWSMYLLFKKLMRRFWYQVLFLFLLILGIFISYLVTFLEFFHDYNHSIAFIGNFIFIFDGVNLSRIYIGGRPDVGIFYEPDLRVPYLATIKNCILYTFDIDSPITWRTGSLLGLFFVSLVPCGLIFYHCFKGMKATFCDYIYNRNSLNFIIALFLLFCFQSCFSLLPQTFIYLPESDFLLEELLEDEFWSLLKGAARYARRVHLTCDTLISSCCKFSYSYGHIFHVVERLWLKF